jgi:hypothetical protein
MINKKHIDKLGTVIFSQTARAKRLAITIRPFKGVRVSFPKRISVKKAQKYLENNFNWTLKNFRHIKRLEKEHKSTLSISSNIKNVDEAKEFLRKRLKQLSQLNGFSYNRVFIRNQKTRWGSCSEKNNINLNIRLFNLRSDLRDYVILHELVHTKIKNHSKKFWNELDKFTGGQAKQLDKQLKKHY